MQLFLHISIAREPLLTFSNKVQAMQEMLPGVSVFDMDNHSDALTTQTALNAIQQSEKIFLHIEAEPGGELGAALKILNQVMRAQSPIAIFYNGQHEMLNSMMKRFEDKVLDHGTNLKAAAKDFFNP